MVLFCTKFEETKYTYVSVMKDAVVDEREC